jgi:hypothetical protein
MNRPLLTWLAATTLALTAACAPKGDDTLSDLMYDNGRVMVLVRAQLDTVMEATSRVLAQERIALRRYDPETGEAESGFIDIAAYRDYDPELWDDTERMVKLRFHAAPQDTTTLLVCEPLYNPYEIITHETDYSRLRPVPIGHPGFDVAASLTRRIAAYAEGKAVTRP